MRAVMVSVDYTDLLTVTMPRNRKHFSAVCIVTSPADAPNVRPIAERNGAEVFVTDAFYRGGAQFNKFLALEEGLDAFSRDGWLAIMDADVILPADLGGPNRGWPWMTPGKLYGAFRRMAPWPLDPIPDESRWARLYPVHRNVNEFAGYLQVLYGDDPHLGTPPWHQTDWRTAGGADSFFQARWPQHEKVRFPWHVLHLGEAGTNWAGRVTPFSDGSVPEGAAERVATLREMIRKRGRGPDRFCHEKLPPTDL